MWTTEHTVGTTAAPDDVWELWADVPSWPQRNTDLERAELSGPFAEGGTITMYPAGDDPIELHIVEARPAEGFTDEVEIPGARIRTIHRLDRVDDQLRVSYRLEITGPKADDIGPELGPQISADFPDVMQRLVEQAERR